MRKRLHIDVETFSSEDLKKVGAYKYTESIDFEILMVAYRFDLEPIKIVDLAQGEKMPQEFVEGLENPNIEKHAYNATFERLAFRAIGFDIPIKYWFCTMVKASYCGFPLGLDAVGKAMKLKALKLSSGKALIRYFCIPCKPTKTNSRRLRNFPYHNLQKWSDFKDYCKQDVAAESEIFANVEHVDIPAFERLNYILDQKINDLGILIDLDFARKARRLDVENSQVLGEQIRQITGVENPNSLAQLKQWIGSRLNTEIKSLDKDATLDLLDTQGLDCKVKEVLELRLRSSKTSNKKYVAMLLVVCEDGRGHGLFQFYGAFRTGRWAGRLIQLQNLPRNYIKALDFARTSFKFQSYDVLTMLYDQVSDTLSQLIRTAFVAPPSCTFAVSDFSAIEARVIAWFSNETWRMDVFKSHGQIYEASASMMFNLPFEQCTKEADNGIRAKGKVSELALGYQGSVGALTQMGGEEMGLSKKEMKEIVKKWRAASPNIVKFWKDTNANAMRAIKTRKEVVSECGRLKFNFDGSALSITLPSSRELYYQAASLRTKTTTYVNEETGESRKWTREVITYFGVNQKNRQWARLETYGGKLVENIVQATARDLLADSMRRLDEAGFKMPMHVHDEVVAEIANFMPEAQLKKLCRIMEIAEPWAKGLPLVADGYLSEYYKKD